MLTRDAILGAVDLRPEDVEVPEWGGAVRVSTLTGAARNAWEQSLVSGVKAGSVNLNNATARLVAACVVDERGERMFSDADAEALGRKSAAALERVAKVAQRLNGLTRDEFEAAKGN